MKFLKTLFFAILLSLTAIRPGFAQSDAEEAMKKVQEIGGWAQAYYGTVDHLMPLFLNEHLDESMAAIDSEDDERLRKAAANYSQHRMDVLKSMQSAMNALPPIPDLNFLGQQGRELNNALNVQKSQLGVIYNEAAQASGHLETILSRSAKNNSDGIMEIIRQQILASIRMLEAEIVQIDAALIAIPEDNPNRPFQLIMKAHNIITIEEMKMELKTQSGPIGLAERRPHINIIQEQLAIAERNINMCDTKTASSVAEFKSYKSQASKPEELAFFDKLVKAIESFGPQMDIERQILSAAKSSAAAYASSGMSDSYQSVIETNDNKILELAEQRVKIMDERIATLAK